jgi:transcriptional regulator with PAS, ATPase and Fis domain
VLENGEFIRVGSSKIQKTNVRVVAATNVNLLQAVEKGQFREDLYYRLGTVPIYVPPLRERGADVLLLFRKFAADFSEKYRTKPVTLTDEAGRLLMQYRFPGNIRQLKNLVEQLSVLEMEREVTPEALRRYLPEDGQSHVPALVRDNNKGDNGFSERDLLYKVLFDMKKDVNELKKLVYDRLRDDHQGDKVIRDHPDLFDGVADEEVDDKPVPQNTHLLLEPPRRQRPNDDEEDTIELARIEDIPHETEDDSLLLEKQEKEMILRALRKNKNKRKYAARDLGISERTLYRKIKQYEIE